MVSKSGKDNNNIENRMAHWVIALIAIVRILLLVGINLSFKAECC